MLRVVRTIGVLRAHRPYPSFTRQSAIRSSTRHVWPHSTRLATDLRAALDAKVEQWAQALWVEDGEGRRKLTDREVRFIVRRSRGER